MRIIKETGIIMSGDHPKKILDSIKTQTRRTYGLGEINKHPDAWEHIGFDNLGRFSFRFKYGDRILNIKCPYGQVGDRLWVRETYKYLNKEHTKIAYRASLETYTDGNFVRLGNWRPSIFLPRWASRIDREITRLRVERLQDIPPEDVIKEGFKSIAEFRDYWNFLNAKWKRVYNRELKIYEFWQFSWSVEDAKSIPKTAKYPERYHSIPNCWVWVITIQSNRDTA